MSIKDLFGKRSNQILSSADLEKLEKDIESHEYAEEKLKDKAKFIPKAVIDFEDPSTFARYGSAKKYYEDAILSILNTYPYDGSLKEKLEWHNKATYIDNWIFKNKYPKTTGYVSLNAVGSSVTAIGGVSYKITTNPQYIEFKGNLHQDSSIKDGEIAKAWANRSNVYSPAEDRNINLHVDGDDGNTIEFWWRNDAPLQSGYECLFDLWNGLALSAEGYGRILIEHPGHGSTDLFRLTYTTTISNVRKGIITTAIGDNTEITTTLGSFKNSDWNHYAFTFINNGTNEMLAKLYINGQYINKITASGSDANIGTIGQSTTPIAARIGAYHDQQPDDATTPFVDIDGAARGSFDEFRFWKKARTAEEIGRHWFTQVGGGTNTDDANVELGIYYKFNEGILGSKSIDANVLDYSGRISNGTIVNYSSGIRSTKSAIEESNSNRTEFKDPILYSSHERIQSLIDEFNIEGEDHDAQNNASIYNTIPEWIRQEDEDGNRDELLNLTQAIASYFDTLYLQVEALPSLANINYSQEGEKPLPFARHLLESVGLVAPDMFVDATVMESLLGKNDEMVFEDDLNNVKNLIYQNIYNNIAGIYKSKGTEKAFRNLMHCFGVGDQLIKINLYGNDATYKLEDNTKSIAVKKNYINFNHEDRFSSGITPLNNKHIEGVAFDATTGSGELDHIPFTLETEIIFPKKLPVDHPNYFSTPFTTTSLFGMVETPDGSNSNYSGLGVCDFKVVAIRPEKESSDVKFKLDPVGFMPTTYIDPAIEIAGSTEDYIQVDVAGSTLDFGTGSFTISAWVKTTDSYGMIFANHYERPFIFKVQNGVLYADYSNAEPRYGAINVADGVWHHVVSVLNAANNQVLFYVDGVHDRTYTDADFGVVENNIGHTIYIAQYDPSSTVPEQPPYYFFDGSLSHVAVWDVALDAAAVSDIYNHKKPLDLNQNSGGYTHKDNLVGWWKLGEGDTLPTILDSSSNSNNGTLLSLSPSISSDIIAHPLETDTFKDVYDNQKWNFAARIKVEEAPLVNNFDGATTDTKYFLEFYGVSMLLDVVQEEFKKQVEITEVSAKKALNSAKTIYAGANKTNTDLSDDDKTDVKVGRVLYWLDYLDNDTIKSHAKDVTNYGRLEPYKTAYFGQSDASIAQVPQSETLALHWDFETSATHPTAPSISVEDVSFVGNPSGLDLTDRYGSLGAILKKEHSGAGVVFNADDKKAVERNYIFTAKQQLPEILNSSDTISILTEEDEVFTRDSRPINHFWAIEKSMYQTISEEIVNIFGTITSFNNLIGEPVNRYRTSYKRLEKLKQLFFEGVAETASIERYIEFYKWIDSAIGNIIQELIPATADVSEDLRTVIESHILERNKYRAKFPTLDSVRDEGRKAGSVIYETNIKGVSDKTWSLYYSTVIDPGAAGQLQLAQTPSARTFSARIAAHVPGHPEGASDVLSNLIQASSEQELNNLYSLSVDTVSQFETNMNSLSIENIPPSSPSPAAFPATSADENPTSVVNKTSGNYRNIYDVVQTSSRSLNNRWFVKRGGHSVADLISIPSTSVLGHYDFVFPDRTEFGKAKHVIVERFSAPGSSYSMPLGMLDIEAEEFSSYNSLNFRNLDVRRYLTKWLTEHYDTEEVSYEDIAGISIYVPKTEISSGGFHKVPRNTTYVRQKAQSSSSGSAQVASSHTSGSSEYTIKKKYDNFWKQNQIPARGHQYHWINSSMQDVAGLQGFAGSYTNVSAQYPAIDTNPSSTNYGKAVGDVPKKGRTSYRDAHSHTYIVDENGNGITSTDDGHYHNVVNWKLSQVCEGQATACSLADCSFTLGTPFCECDTSSGSGQTQDYNYNEARLTSTHCNIADCNFTLGSPTCLCVDQAAEPPATTSVLSSIDCHSHTIQATAELGFPTLNLFQTLGSKTQEQIRIIDKSGTEVTFDEHSTTLEGNYILGDDILSDDIWKKYEDGTTTLNELLLNRSGPYPYPSWKQIRNVDNPMVIAQRKSNVISVINRTNSSNTSEKDTATNYIEPVVTWNKSMSHGVSFATGSGASLSHTYNNNLEVFANKSLKERVGFVKNKEQMYDLIKKQYNQSIQMKSVEYGEIIFPKKGNNASLKTRDRINYKESAGLGLGEYDRRSTEIRTFWKDKPLERRRTPYNAGDYTIAGRNAFDVGVRNSSTWALDYHKHKSRIGEASFRDGHIHTYEVDENGNGITSTDDGHFHTIKDWQMLNFCECDITDCDFDLNSVFCEGDCGEDPVVGTLNSTVISDCHTHILQNETVMRGDLAWAGYAQTRGYIYNSTEPEAIDERTQGGPSLKETNSWAAPRPALQYIHNPNTMKAKEEGWPWDAGKTADNTPWQDSYTKYKVDTTPQGKDYSLLPEYRVSKHMDFYINDSKGNFRIKVDDKDIMEIQGISETLDSAALEAYSVTEDIKHIEKVSTDHKEETQMLRLEIDAIIKLLPYNGFYPSQRSVQLGGLFYDSVIPHVTGTKDNVEVERARTAQAALQPYFAPGILFNSIKSGIAVDWAAYAGKYDGGNEEISMRDKFLGRSFMSKSGMNTEAGKAVMKRAMAAWTRDVKLGKVDKSDYDDKKKGFNSYYCAALNSAGKQYNRLFKIVSQECNTRDFIGWCNSRGLTPSSTAAQSEFRQNVCGDSNWNYNPALTTELYKTNVESLLGKDIIPSSNNNPNNVKMIVSTILADLEDLPEQSPNIADDVGTISERDLEGAYMDFAPNKRIPFEGLVSISKGLSNLHEDQSKLFYAAPSYYLERFEVGSNLFDALKHCDTEQDLYNNLRYPYFEWTGDSTALYELAMHNFLAEIPNFFMKNKKFTTFQSAPENKFEDAEIGKTYYMDVSLYKQGSFDMTLSPFDGTLAKVEESASSANDELIDLSGNPYTTQGRYYGPALRYKPLSTSNKDNFYIGDPAQAAYTPPYFYGKAIARLSYKATKTNPSLNDILSNLSIEYINAGLDEKFAAHSPNSTYVNTPAYKGRMPLESSINIKGKTTSETATTDGSKINSWTLYPKFESPVLNFNTDANKKIIKDSAEAGKPRGIGMWSGYGEIPKGRDGLYFELVDSFAPEEELAANDETKYIVSIGIPSDVRSLHGNIIQLFEPLKDADTPTSEIRFGQPSSDGEQIFPETSIDSLQSEFFGLTQGTQFYHQDSRIRTVYTSQHATKNNPRVSMQDYDIEAYFQPTTPVDTPASNLVPRPFDIANAICYHINYNNQTDEDYNWRASVKWVSDKYTSDVVGASLEALSDKDPAYKDNNLTGFGAVVEIEWVRPEGNFTANNIPEIRINKDAEKTGLRCLKPANSRYKPNFKVGYTDNLEFYPRITSSKAKKTVSNYGSLIDLCGFSRNEIKSKVGELALEKDISEGIVMIPFVEAPITDPGFAPTIEIGGKNFFSISDMAYEAANGESISSMKENMQKYNLPPHYDFAKYSGISPFVMYIFEFTEKLDQDDLSNIWQGMMPNAAKRSTKFNNDPSDKYSNKQSIEHELNEDNFFEGKKLPPTSNPLKWITFKVKRRANIDYYKVTADTTDDKNFSFTTSEGESLKPDYSYNWPYDYFSLVELAKITGGINIVPKKKEEDEE